MTYLISEPPSRYNHCVIFTYILILSLLAFTPSRAQPPTPSKKQDLSALQNQLSTERSEEEALSQKLTISEKELKKTKEALVTVGEKVRKNQNARNNLQKRIEENSVAAQKLEKKLEDNYGSISSLVLALERLERIPPESLIARPGAPIETAQSAMLLQKTMPAIGKRASMLSADLKELSRLKNTLETDQKKLESSRKELLSEQKKLESLLKKRALYYEQTDKELGKRRQEIARLSRESKTLMDLLGRLENRRSAGNNNYKNPSSRKPSGKYIPLPASGQKRLPVAGYLIESYGQKNEIGARTLGVRLQTNPNALVVAPMGGIIRFTGNFKNYGNMVIIEHKGGYHSLIGGLSDISAPIDAQVKSGEPIGKLPVSTSLGDAPSLYYELRLNGQPTDPSKLFAELKT